MTLWLQHFALQLLGYVCVYVYMCSMCLEVSGSEATTSAFVQQQGGKAARGEGLQSRSDI